MLTYDLHLIIPLENVNGVFVQESDRTHPSHFPEHTPAYPRIPASDPQSLGV